MAKQSKRKSAKQSTSKKPKGATQKQQREFIARLRQRAEDKTSEDGSDSTAGNLL